MSRDYRVQFWGAVTGAPIVLAVALGLAGHHLRTRKHLIR